jgi:hypothetical protein
MEDMNQKLRDKEAQLGQMAKAKADKDRQYNEQAKLDQVRREKELRQRNQQEEERKRV